MLAGAPRTGRWVKETEKKRIGGRHQPTLVLLATVAVLTLGGIGIYAFLMQRQLQQGLLSQYREHRARRDWVRLAELPRHVGPLLGRDLLTQVYRLGGGVGDQARRVMMVPLLEQRLSRRALLELYLNRVYLGKTGDWPVYGVRHAAEEYFGKTPERLTVGEAATLAGILLPPALTNPEAEPGAVGPRRNEVLRNMVAAGDIDEAAFRQAMAEPLGFQPGIDYAPMTRPAGWEKEPAPITLPPELRPRADSAASPAPPSPGT